MSASSIEWTDEVWNPVTGCTRVSPGCAHCYALELAPRLRAMGLAKYQRARDGGRGSGPAFGVTLHESELEAPLRWRRPRRVFVNSMSDLFHDEVPDEFIGRVFAVMAAAQQHTFQVLTKRPERMQDVIRASSWEWSEGFTRGWGFGARGRRVEAPAWPLPNVWLGVSIENRRYMHRADYLRDTPAAVRFISAEPLLGPLVPESSRRWRPEGHEDAYLEDHDHGRHRDGECPGCEREARNRRFGPGLDLSGIDWLIVGGESGPRHRRIDEQWVRDLRDAARAAGTAFFFKQWGGRTPKAGGRELDGRTWDEMPDVVAGPSREDHAA